MENHDLHSKPTQQPASGGFQVVSGQPAGEFQKVSHISGKEDTGVPVMADLSLNAKHRTGVKTFWMVLLVLAGVVLLLAAALGVLEWREHNSQSSGASVQLTLEQPPVSETESTSLDGGLSTEEIAAAAEDSVVGVITASLNSSGDGYITNSQGSGVILTSDGYIVTNAHVIGTADDANQTYLPAERIVVYFHNGESVDASLIAFDTNTDLAVIKVEVQQELTPAQLGDPDALVLGERVVAIGNPGGISLSGTITQGIVSGLDRTVTVGKVGGDQIPCIQTDAAINTGNSGGALLNKYGQVVGIVAIKMGDSYENIGFAIPMDLVKSVAEELISHGNVLLGRVRIGITYTTITQEMSSLYGVPAGLRIVEVDSESDCAGKLQPGDIVTAMDGSSVTDSSDIDPILQTKVPGDPLVLTVYRADENGEGYKTISIALMGEG